MEDARGYTTTYAYDADNNLVSVTDPLNNVTTYVYDADDEVINMIDPNGGHDLHLQQPGRRLDDDPARPDRPRQPTHTTKTATS